MTEILVISWNIRGLSTPLKRSMILAGLKNFQLAIFCFQETHLTEDTKRCLRYPWVGVPFHSHLIFLGGVSMVHGSLDYQAYDANIDSEGRFVFLLCRIGSLQCVFA